MKRIKFCLYGSIFSFIIALAVVCAIFCVPVKNNNVYAATDTNILSEELKTSLGITALNTGNTVKMNIKTSQTIDNKTYDEYLSYLSVSVNTWSEISEIKIRKVIGNNIFELSKDDQITEKTISSGDDSKKEFLFSQSGIYISTIKKTNGNVEHNYIKFERQTGTNFIIVSNISFLPNFDINGTIGNVFFNSTGVSTFSIVLNTNLYKTSDDSSISGISIVNASIENNTIDFNDAYENIVSSFSYLSVTKLPLIAFISEETVTTELEDLIEDGEITDVLTKLNNSLYPLSTTKFFNINVKPVLNFDSIEEEFVSLFKILIEKDANGIPKSASVVFNSESETQVLSTQDYRIITDYDDYFTIERNGNPYENIDTLTSTTTLYSFGDNLEARAKSTYSVTILSGTENRAFFVVKNQNTIVSAFTFKWIKYAGVNALTVYSGTHGDGIFHVEVARENGKRLNIPVDVTISKDSNSFCIYDLFKNQPLTVYAFKIVLNTPGQYGVQVNFRGETADAYKQTIEDGVLKDGPIITATTSSGVVENYQYVDKPVTISANRVCSVSYKGNIIANLTPGSTYTTSQNGLYSVIAGIEGNQTVFQFISIFTKLTSFSASDFEKTQISSITRYGAIIEKTGSSTFLKDAGNYTIRCSTSSIISIQLGDNNNWSSSNIQNTNLTSLTDSSFSIIIAPTTFSIVSNCNNGDKISKSLKISSISANGNWTLKVKTPSGTKTYTKEQWDTLSAKKKTFSKNGVYTFTLTDENGNTFEATYTKYYKMDLTIIILVVVVCIGGIVGLFFFLKVRGKQKVK